MEEDRTEVTERLLQLLAAGDDESRLAAAQALGRVSLIDYSILRALGMSALKDENCQVRAAAAASYLALTGEALVLPGDAAPAAPPPTERRSGLTDRLRAVALLPLNLLPGRKAHS